MTRTRLVCLCAAAIVAGDAAAHLSAQIGSEAAVPVHLRDGEEYTTPMRALIRFGERLFTAAWTIEDGGGRPLTKGTGAPLAATDSPLAFPRNFNRLSGPDANSCAGCHNRPAIGGGGDIVANVFVLAQRFDFLTFDALDGVRTRGAVDEIGRAATLQTAANSRKTIGMFGSGYIEMLARQMTADLQAIRDATPAGGSRALVTKGISFGVIARRADGTWDVSRVVGLPAPSVRAAAPDVPPNLIVRPFHQAGAVVSLRQFTNNAFNHHHGIQSEERFGLGVDADGDGVADELTRADVTAATLYQATLPVPGQVISRDPEVRQAVRLGRRRFRDAGCAACHVPQLPLDRRGWIFSEPNPYNPAGNLRPGDAPPVTVDLTSSHLPGPRLQPLDGVVYVPAFTDLKLHDITRGPDDPNREPLDMNETPGSPAFFAGNSRFITRKLWGVANQHSFGHHGMYTTMREAILAHAGEADDSRRRFEQLSRHDQDSVVEFLKSLQILLPGVRSPCVVDDGEEIRCDGVNDSSDR